MTMHNGRVVATPGALLATGATSQIYAWREGWVLKLFIQEVSRDTVENEASLTRIIHSSGIPAPAVGDIVEVNGRLGLELERLDGVSMLDALTAAPWKLSSFARQLAELHAEMHTRAVTGIPKMRERLQHKINRAAIPDDVRWAALNALEELPEDDKLCHGDFHPGNILLTQRGPMIIDWLDAMRGSPLLDIARSSLLFGSGRLPQNLPHAWLLNLIQRPFYHVYQQRYFQLHPADREQLPRWVPVVAAARLDENVSYDQVRLLAIARRLVDANSPKSER
jgi:uncharacterized protein (TIGR02172 family)